MYLRFVHGGGGRFSYCSVPFLCHWCPGQTTSLISRRGWGQSDEQGLSIAAHCGPAPRASFTVPSICSHVPQMNPVRGMWAQVFLGELVSFVFPEHPNMPHSALVSSRPLRPELRRSDISVQLRWFFEAK